jgi:hypothetical protein
VLRIAEALAAGLGIGLRFEEVAQTTWSVGTFVGAPAGALPVFLTIQSSPEGLLRVVTLLPSEPIVLLAPTSELCDQASAGLLRARRSQLLALDELVTVAADGSWQSATSLLEAVAQSAAPALQEENIFRLGGRVWTLRFDGRTTYVPAELGFQYLAILLGHSQKELHVGDVLSLAADRPVSLAGGDAVLDKRAFRDYTSARDGLKEFLQEARADRDRKRERDIQEKIDDLDGRLKAATGLRGRPRKLNPEVEKASKSVSTAIKRAIDRLEEEHPPLHAHLQAFVHCGQYLSYQPDGEITWVTD